MDRKLNIVKLRDELHRYCEPTIRIRGCGVLPNYQSATLIFYTVGLIFAFNRNRFVGSNLFLSSTNRG